MVFVLITLTLLVHAVITRVPQFSIPKNERAVSHIVINSPIFYYRKWLTVLYINSTMFVY
ncbi:hypothetical protein BBBOND_0204550 [Babesia bigemina]|uniref:Uncharacterized protein n=1 Tax=Babesia bigemina TaxID=5866 RepID=A0A061D5M6_BABBI|nr:hypothetical protein BBBOND_0204550 [Babesia bigemina]CDR95297.1 hypothetical protein BBBOND_0204550 [Babesia bigemina]|eukprot:XP_012767483.1 hypothetical protein BBBOND_0204550 [Babesia bigemina]